MVKQTFNHSCPIKKIFVFLLLFFMLSACDYLTGGDDDCRSSIGEKYFSLRYLEEEEAKFLEIINEYRLSQNPPLTPLVSSATLNQAAYDYSVVMSRTGWFDHTGPDGSSPWERMCNGGHLPACNGSAVMGENIAAGYATARDVFEAWRSSPGHNANMLGEEFRAIGIGLANVEDGVMSWVWTTDFSSETDVNGCACSDGEISECEREGCGKGLKECLGLCQWSECAPPNFGIEICDGYDNDCNGLVDEGDVCHGCTPSKEVCDDKDNDCDHLVDEDNVCGTECEPSEEVCDGADNNCNGTIDEGCSCVEGSPQRVCGYDEGICRKGIQTCEGGVWSECEGAVAPRVEICDGMDNNCNGAIDEHVCQEVGEEDGGDESGGCGCVWAGEQKRVGVHWMIYSGLFFLVFQWLVNYKNKRKKN